MGEFVDNATSRDRRRRGRELSGDGEAAVNAGGARAVGAGARDSGTIAEVTPSAELLGRLVRECVDAPDTFLLGEALEDLLFMVEATTKELLVTVAGWSRHHGLDGPRIDNPCVMSDGVALSRAFQLLDRPERMLPMRADLRLQAGAISRIDVADQQSTFELPQSPRQFARGLQRAVWRHRFELELG